MKKLYAGCLAVLFVGLALTVLAASPDGGPGQAPGRSVGPVQGPGAGPGGSGPRAHEPVRFHHHFGEHLNLSAEQKDKMGELETRYFNETRDLRYDVSFRRLEMRKLFTDPKTDEAALYAKQKELNGALQKLHDKMGQMRIEGRKILTVEQIRKLDRMAPMDPAMPPPPMRPGMMHFGVPGFHCP